MSPAWLLALRLGLFISTFGWGISFFFTFEPWDQAVARLYEMGATPIEYQPLLGYWLKMASAVFGFLGVVSAICFLWPDRFRSVIVLWVPLHLFVGATLMVAALSNHLERAKHPTFVWDILFCFSVAALIGIPLTIEWRSSTRRVST